MAVKTCTLNSVHRFKLIGNLHCDDHTFYIQNACKLQHATVLELLSRFLPFSVCSLNFRTYKYNRSKICHLKIKTSKITQDSMKLKSCIFQCVGVKWQIFSLGFSCIRQKKICVYCNMPGKKWVGTLGFNFIFF